MSPSVIVSASVAQMMFQLNRCLQGGVDACYADFEEFLWDWYSDLTGAPDLDAQIIERLLAFPNFDFSQIKSKFGFDLEADLREALEENLADYLQGTDRGIGMARSPCP